MQYYFAYGSNLHHEQMKRRCPKCKYIKKHILHDYQLTFRSKYGACDIEKKLGKKFNEEYLAYISDLKIREIIEEDGGLK